MTADWNERRHRALKDELSQIRQYVTSTRRDHDESARLTHLHVDGLARLLHEPVGSALRGEVGTAITAENWVSEARTVATWLLRTGAVDTGAVLASDGPKSSVGGFKSRLAKFLGFASTEVPARSQSAVAATERQLIDALGAKLKDASYFSVDDEEVWEHCADLARLLISNWFAVLEEAVETQPAKAVKLEYRAFPPTASPGVVTEGCEGFALPAELALSKVFEYQQSLAKVGETVTLSPIVSLYRSERGPWYAFHSKHAEVLNELRSEEEPACLRLKDAIERATEAFSPLVIGRAMQFQASPLLSTSLSHRCAYQAANAVRRRFKELADQGSCTGQWTENYQLASSQLTKNIALAVLKDLEALEPNSAFHLYRRVGPANNAALLFLLEKEGESRFLGDAYMVALPVTAALLAEEDSFNSAYGPLESTFDCLELTAPEQEVFNTTIAIVSSAITEANEQSDQEALSRKLRGMMEPGHAPSAFPLLVS